MSTGIDPQLSLKLEQLSGTPFASVRDEPWHMILAGPLMVGLHRTACACGASALLRTYHAGTVALLRPDADDEAATIDRRQLGTSDAVDLAMRFAQSPCWVHGGPLRLRSLRAAPPVHVRETIAQAVDAMGVQLAPHRRLDCAGGRSVLADTCPSCGSALDDPCSGSPDLLIVVVDEHGADMRPVAMVCCL
jgi:hypothetical protein